MMNNIIQYFQEADTYQILDVVGTVIGLVYIYQEYKASIWLWLTGLIMPIVYTFVYYEAKLYADFGMQIYYILAAVYGFLYWQFGRKKKENIEVPITRFPKQKILPTLFIFLLLWGAIYYVLITFTNSNVPVLDSFGNVLSIVGLWALAKKYIEQWWIWVVADIELSALYIYKNIPFTAGLYALYAIIAVAGFYKWKKMMKENDENIKL
ncbi:nicotinamide mononucleotide transporter PnuC [Prevotella disiens FB035-09AN]|uniref:Nicotinamide riboside transporter PnuC n=1 Tax=Prevotella disiens FB035-09AN TaxID=866771 RepID=E1KP44_9BACT|nr:nicotinamide riboside transporter PnuC [Prevotella disiens]EFL46872.1 nicotinamide mononucleotide transporter PnuC [Prevotella disiens FB035-09AN]